MLTESWVEGKSVEEKDAQPTERTTALWGLSSKIVSRIWVNFTRNGLRLGSRHQEPPHTDDEIFTSCTQPCPSDLSAHTHPVCDVCVRTLWLTLHSHGASASTLDGGRVWSVVLTQLRGIFLLEDAHCHRSCHFWTVYSRIMMTSFKQTCLLSCIVFLYERSMYPFHSSVTSQTHMPQEPPHTDVSRNLATVVVFLLLSHSWTTDNVRGVLSGLRRRTGLLPSGPKSSFQMRASFVFHLETKVLESGGRVEKLIAQVAWSPVLSFHSLWWFGVQCHLLVLVHCVFLKTNVTAPIYQEIVEHFLLPSADQLFKDADFIFQQDLAPAHTAKSTKSWLNDHGVGVLDWPANQTWTP